MDSRDADRELIEKIISEYAQFKYAYGDIQRQTVFDRNADRYLLMIAGWEGVQRVHGCIIHVDLIDGKFWIQRDGTEDGVASWLLDAGVPKDRIVLAFRSLELRKHTGFAVT